MGDPRRLTPHFNTPGHPWQKDRIEVEKKMLKEYGLKNKTEIWRLNTKIKGFAQQAKNLIAATGTQAEREKDQLFQRLQKLGLIQAGAKLDDILGLTLKNILDRRLQSVVHKKGFSRTTKQARQFITHNHVSVSGKIITAPSYLVLQAEEPSVEILGPLSKVDHPERVPLPPKKKSAAKSQVDDRRRFRRGRGRGGRR